MSDAPGTSNPQRPPPALSAPEQARLERRARIGAWLIALGILGILWGVFHMLSAVGGPEKPDFAHRQRYDEVKVIVQREMFGALLRSLVGLAVAMAGGYLRGAALRALGRSD